MAQSTYAVGTKLTTPFGTTYTVTDPNQFFATGPGGYNPITTAAAQPTSQPSLASPSVPTNTSQSTVPLAPNASAALSAPALPVSKPVDPISTFVQSPQFTSAPAGTIIRNAQTGQQYYKTSGGGLVSISSVAQLQDLARQGLVRPGSDIYYNQPSANVAPTNTASTPPPGATLITGPSGLQGLTESQIWRQPGTNNIYRLAGATPSTAPSAPPGAPAVPTEPVKVDLGDYIPSDIFTGAFTMPKSTYDIGAVIASQQKMQQAYLDSLQPSAQEQDLNSQLQKILDQASGTQINLQAGLNKIEDQPIPMPFITGQQASIQRQANTQLQSLALQQQSLAQRLGLVQQSRLAQSEGLKTAVGFGTQNIQLAFQMQQAIDAQQQAVLERAAQLQSSSREVLATILDKFQGLDFSTLDPVSQQQLLQVAAQAGIPADVLVKGLETVKNQLMFDNATKLQAGSLTSGQILNSATQLMATGQYASLTDAIAAVQQAVGLGGQPGAVAGALVVTPGTGTNRADRNNNPLNIKLGSLTQKWIDAGLASVEAKPAADGGNFLVFTSPEAGFTAAEDLLKSPRYANLTLDAAMRTWSGGGYGAEVAPDLNPQKTISQLTDQELGHLMASMAKREGFSGTVTPGQPSAPVKDTLDFQTYLDQQEQAAGMNFDAPTRKKLWDVFNATHSVVTPEGVVDSPAKQAARAILDPSSNSTIADYPNEMRMAITTELKKLRDAIPGGSAVATLALSAGGKEMDAAQLQQITKIETLVGQVDALQTLFTVDEQGKKAQLDLSPITGIIRSNNPFDTKAQLIKNALTSIVPNLARGVFGEVGILTDKDVKMYSRTLPNLSSTEAVRNGVLALTVLTMQRSFTNILTTAANGGRDVSGFIDTYKGMTQQVAGLLAKAGIETSIVDGSLYLKTDKGWELSQ